MVRRNSNGDAARTTIHLVKSGQVIAGRDEKRLIDARMVEVVCNGCYERRHYFQRRQEVLDLRNKKTRRDMKRCSSVLDTLVGMRLRVSSDRTTATRFRVIRSSNGIITLSYCHVGFRQIIMTGGGLR